MRRVHAYTVAVACLAAASLMCTTFSPSQPLAAVGSPPARHNVAHPSVGAPSRPSASSQPRAHAAAPAHPPLASMAESSSAVASPEGSGAHRVLPARGGQVRAQHGEESSVDNAGRRRRRVLSGMGAAVAGLVIAEALPARKAEAAAAKDASEESKEVVECLFKKCRGELFGCLENPVCTANLLCLSQCTGKPDEIDCQVKCGDLFQTSAIDKFNDCAISRGKCVPQRPDEDLFPVPPPAALVSEFDMTKFTGKWFISLGANPLFDIFDCQLHTFDYDKDSQMLVGDLTWRVSTPDGGFLTRQATQTFRQDKEIPGLLVNDGNEFLHYSDDWYIASAQLDGTELDHVFVYYRGSNDAWDGYGGAVLYTRQATMPKKLAPIIAKACEGLPTVKYSDLKATDNQCKAELPVIERTEYVLAKTEKIIEKDAKQVITALEREEEVVLNEIEDKILDLEGEIYKDQAVNAKLGQEVANDLAFLLKGLASEVSKEGNEIKGYAKRLGMAIVDGEKQFVAKEQNLLQKLLQAFTSSEKKVLEDLEMDVKDVEQLLGNTFGSGVIGSAKRASKVTAVAAK